MSYLGGAFTTQEWQSNPSKSGEINCFFFNKNKNRTKLQVQSSWSFVLSHKSHGHKPNLTIHRRGTWRKGHHQKELCPHPPALPIRKCPSSSQCMLKAHFPVLRHIFEIAKQQKAKLSIPHGLCCPICSPLGSFNRPFLRHRLSHTEWVECTQAAGPPPSHTLSGAQQTSPILARFLSF